MYVTLSSNKHHSIISSSSLLVAFIEYRECRCRLSAELSAIVLKLPSDKNDTHDFANAFTSRIIESRTSFECLHQAADAVDALKSPQREAAYETIKMHDEFP